MSKLLEAIKNARECIAHQNGPGNACPDGMASAILVHDALPKIPLRFANHEELERLTPMPEILFVDIAPPRRNAAEWAAQGGVVVLDHHEHQKDVVEMFGELGVYSDELGVSGAVLTLRHVHHPIRGDNHFASEFARLAGVRDTWQKQDPDWHMAREQAEALRFWPRDDLFAANPFTDRLDRFTGLMQIGAPLVAKRDATAKAHADRAVVRYLPSGLRIAMLNTLETSDVADLIAADVLVGFAYTGKGSDSPILQLSFRSRGAVDVGAIAKKLDGGGHRSAAGARVPAPSTDPYAWIIALMREQT